MRVIDDLLLLSWRAADWRHDYTLVAAAAAPHQDLDGETASPLSALAAGSTGCLSALK
jgi:hypothetical protein